MGKILYRMVFVILYATTGNGIKKDCSFHEAETIKSAFFVTESLDLHAEKTCAVFEYTLWANKRDHVFGFDVIGDLTGEEFIHISGALNQWNSTLNSSEALHAMFWEHAHVTFFLDPRHDVDLVASPVICEYAAPRSQKTLIKHQEDQDVHEWTEDGTDCPWHPARELTVSTIIGVQHIGDCATCPYEFRTEEPNQILQIVVNSHLTGRHMDVIVEGQLNGHAYRWQHSRNGSQHLESPFYSRGYAGLVILSDAFYVEVAAVKCYHLYPPPFTTSGGHHGSQTTVTTSGGHHGSQTTVTHGNYSGSSDGVELSAGDSSEIEDVAPPKDRLSNEGRTSVTYVSVGEDRITSEDFTESMLMNSTDVPSRSLSSQVSYFSKEILQNIIRDKQKANMEQDK